jgi:hypothetical protein
VLFKIARARRHAATGAFPATFDSIVSAIPSGVVAALTGRQLGALIDAIEAHRRESRAIEEAAACDAGYIWDAAVGRARDLSPRVAA